MLISRHCFTEHLEGRAPRHWTQIWAIPQVVEHFAELILIRVSHSHSSIGPKLPSTGWVGIASIGNGENGVQQIKRAAAPL